jgi:hypothetical protein
MSTLITEYEPRIARSRSLVGEASVLHKLLDVSIPAEVLERFLIEYCSLGVQITEPVEGWIRRAGERCRELGLEATGSALCDHASHEADHHLMFIEDTRRLVAHWNAAHPQQLDAQALIARAPTRAMQHYIELHEDTIASEQPFAQVAIELEIERLSITVLPQLLTQFRRVLGDEVMSSLSFLGSHAALDVGHTHINTRLMSSLMTQRPSAAADLARIGAEAMFIYLAFFDECLELALRACSGAAEACSNPAWCRQQATPGALSRPLIGAERACEHADRRG